MLINIGIAGALLCVLLLLFFTCHMMASSTTRCEGKNRENVMWRFAWDNRLWVKPAAYTTYAAFLFGILLIAVTVIRSI